MGCCSSGYSQEDIIDKETTPWNSPMTPFNEGQNIVNQAIKADIRQDFKFGGVLGRGNFGVVRQASPRHNPDEMRAVKTIDKRKLIDNIGILKNEVENQIQLDHKNICRLFTVYEDSHYLNLVLEYSSGGELFDRIIETGRHKEPKARALIRQMLKSVKYLHSKGISHRDIKPENFLFENKSKSSQIKLIDFGLSKCYKNNGFDSKMSSIVGTAYYVAPEVLKGHYGPECDVWSIGVIMYLLLSGSYPFDGKSNREIFRQILRCKVEFNQYNWLFVSATARDLIYHMLNSNPLTRITAAEALKHPWFYSETPDSKKTTPQKATYSPKISYKARRWLARYNEISAKEELSAIIGQDCYENDNNISFEEIAS